MNPAGREALDRLDQGLRRPLMEFCRLKGRDAELADEIAEASFLRLIVRQPSARRGFIPLLQKTAQNLCRDAQKRRAQAPAPGPAHPHKSLIRAPSGSERVMGAETVQAVRDCLAALDPKDRALVIYHYVGLSLSGPPASCWDGIAPATARLKRAREQLARCLKKNLIF